MSALTTTSLIVPQQRQADTDEHVLALWLHGKADTTQAIYRLDTARFLDYVQKSLDHVTLGDVQQYADSLAELAPATKARMIATVKSLFTFACKIGYLTFNPAAPVSLPTLKNKLSERILDEEAVMKMLALEKDPRNHCLLRLLYASGIRVSELCALTWQDVQERKDGGQVTVYGKGGKTRTILLSAGTWKEVIALRGEAGRTDPVFPSRKHHGFLTRVQVMRIVRVAGARAGLQQIVSPHWMRHAHASHSLDRGAPVHLVQSTLGHASLATTSRYSHARPNESSGKYLPV